MYRIVNCTLQPVPQQHASRAVAGGAVTIVAPAISNQISSPISTPQHPSPHAPFIYLPYLSAGRRRNSWLRKPKSYIASWLALRPKACKRLNNLDGFYSQQLADTDNKMNIMYAKARESVFTARMLQNIKYMQLPIFLALNLCKCNFIDHIGQENQGHDRVIDELRSSGRGNHFFGSALCKQLQMSSVEKKYMSLGSVQFVFFKEINI